MNHEDLYEKIKQSSEEITIPNKIKPEKMNQMLKNSQAPKKKNPLLYVAAPALSFVVMAALVVTVMQKNDMPSSLSNYTGSIASNEAQVLVEKAQEIQDGIDAISSILYPANSYEKLYKQTIDVASEKEKKYYFIEEDAVNEETLNASGAISDLSGTRSDFSNTNLRTEGVDEADMVKTDGTYIYSAIDKSSIRCYKANKGKSTLISTIVPTPEDLGGEIKEIFLNENRLYVIFSKYESTLETDKEGTSFAEDIAYVSNNVTTSLSTYDVSDPKKPVLVATATQDGDYYTARKINQTFYLITSYYPEDGSQSFFDKIKNNFRSSSAAEKEGKNYAPKVNNEAISPCNIFLGKEQTSNDYLVISSISEEKPEEIIDSKAFSTYINNVYVSNQSLYLYYTQYSKNSSSTNIIKINLSEGAIIPKGVGNVPGTINDTFSLDEAEDYLRVVTTSSTQDNGLYILNDKMKIIGKLTNLAPGEQIKSARFMKDIGYFVTFRNMDPLFSVDVSDPKNPKLLGELKITGFSEYLHFFGENQLLGVGYEVNPDTNETVGGKLSMFDISNPSNVTEVKKTVIKSIDEIPALYDYKSFLVSPDKNLIGFMGTDWSGLVADTYYLYTYQPQKGFVLKRKIPIDVCTDKKARGIYIEDYFYLVHKDKVESYSLSD
ncbi:MAG: beta-propeller domain-containing protein [Lachnospiraceae bacterium]|nr:beta-propeller domain-containing protein [Lachnospiraceae bacterium]